MTNLSAVENAEKWLNKQPSCDGYPACSGDLVAELHSKGCAMFGVEQPTPAEILAAYAADVCRAELPCGHKQANLYEGEHVWNGCPICAAMTGIFDRIAKESERADRAEKAAALVLRIWMNEYTQHINGVEVWTGGSGPLNYAISGIRSFGIAPAEGDIVDLHREAYRLAKPPVVSGGKP